MNRDKPIDRSLTLILLQTKHIVMGKYTLKLRPFFLNWTIFLILLFLSFYSISIFDLDLHGTGGTITIIIQIIILFFLTGYLSKKITTVETTDNILFRLSSHYRIFPFHEFTSEFQLKDVDAWRVLDINNYGESFKLYLKSGVRVTFTQSPGFFDKDQYEEFKKDMIKIIDEYNLSIRETSLSSRKKIIDKDEEFYQGNSSRFILYLMWSMFVLLIGIAIAVWCINDDRNAAEALLIISGGFALAGISFGVKYYAARNKKMSK